MDTPPPFQLPFAPRRVLLLSGHRVDAPGRAVPRFPPTMVDAARQRIDAVMDALACDEQDLALTQGASGADLLLAEAAVARRAKLQLMLPLPEREFIACSILPSVDGNDWQRRYAAVRAHSMQAPASLPASTGSSDEPFGRCNDWLCATAAACGAQEIHLVCLWNGQVDEGPGGTAHMIDTVKRLGGQVHWIDTRSLA